MDLGKAKGPKPRTHEVLGLIKAGRTGDNVTEVYDLFLFLLNSLSV